MTAKKQPVKKKRFYSSKLFQGKNPAEVIAKLEQAWTADCSDAQAALFADIHPSSLCRYLQTHPRLVQRKLALLQSMKLRAKVGVLNEVTKGNADMCLKVLERREPREWAPVNKNANTDTAGNDINPQFTKDEGKL